METPLTPAGWLYLVLYISAAALLATLMSTRGWAELPTQALPVSFWLLSLLVTFSGTLLFLSAFRRLTKIPGREDWLAPLLAGLIALGAGAAVAVAAPSQLAFSAAAVAFGVPWLLFGYALYRRSRAAA